MVRNQLVIRNRCAAAEELPHSPSRHRIRSPQALPIIAFLAYILAPASSHAEEPPNPLCTSCHNSDGNSTNPDYPKIAGLDAAYIAKQIKDFKNYKRANNVMGPLSETIDEAQIDALAKYYSKQKRAPEAVTDPSLAAKGQLIYDQGIDATAVPACGGCHETDGSGSRKFPRLAGQHTAYLISQMKNFRSGVRNNDGRMRAVARRLTEDEIVAVAEYIAGLKGGDQ